MFVSVNKAMMSACFIGLKHEYDRGKWHNPLPRDTDVYVYRNTVEKAEVPEQLSNKDGDEIITVRRIFASKGEKPKIMVDIESKFLCELMRELNRDVLDFDHLSDSPSVSLAQACEGVLLRLCTRFHLPFCYTRAKVFTMLWWRRWRRSGQTRKKFVC